jgi:hypothetical protein
MPLERSTLRRITLYVVGASVLLTLVATAIGGLEMGFGAAVGGALAVANFVAMRWVAHRILTANDKGRLVYATLLALKMSALLAITWLILSTGWVDPTGFTIGLSGLVLGILAGAFHTAAAGQPAEPTTTEEQC